VKKRFAEEQIIGLLREAEVGMPVKRLCRKHGFSEASYYLWRSKFGGMSEHEFPDTLTEETRQAIRRELRKNTSAKNKLIGRMRRIIAYSSVPSDVKNHRVGIGLIGVAILIVLTVLILPRKDGTWFFMACAWLLAWCGAWRIDRVLIKR